MGNKIIFDQNQKSLDELIKEDEKNEESYRQFSLICISCYTLLPLLRIYLAKCVVVFFYKKQSLGELVPNIIL